jgi:hypothetical protein
MDNRIRKTDSWIGFATLQARLDGEATTVT